MVAISPNNSGMESQINQLVIHQNALNEKLLAEQRRIVEDQKASGQLHALNFFWNYKNYKTSQELRADYQLVKQHIQQGRLMLSNIQKNLSTQQNQINGVETKVDDMEVEQKKLSKEVDQQKQEIKVTMKDFEGKLQKQQVMIMEQEKTLSRLLRHRFYIDLFIDAVILLVSYKISHASILNSLFNFIIRSFASLFFEYKKLASAKVKENIASIAKLFQWALLVLCAKQIRYLAVEKGMHHLVGGYTVYGRKIMNFVGWQADKLGIRLPPSVQEKANNIVETSMTFTRGKAHQMFPAVFAAPASPQSEEDDTK